MSAKQLMLPANRAFNSNGLPEAGCKIYLYASGGLVPANFYADSGLTTSLGPVLTANAAGRLAQAAYQDPTTAFRLITRDAGGVQLDDIDPFFFGTQIYWVTTAVPGLKPEDFGAVGNGTTDDGPAFAALSAAINAAKQGAVWLSPGKTYAVGGQTLNGSTPNGTYRYAPTTVYPLEISGCTGPVVIYANGAKIKCLSGKRFGSFNADGTVYSPSLPFSNVAYAASPYFAMVYIHDNTGPVSVIGTLELDGNIGAATIGGQFGDTGWQLPMYGLQLVNNSGPIAVNNVITHHHGLDGCAVNGTAANDAASRIQGIMSGVKSYCNGRQGLSLTGGKGWTFRNCSFNWTGKANPNSDTAGPVSSNPGAGVDLEAEGGNIIRDIAFEDCDLIGNTGAGLVSDNTDVDRVNLKRCTIIGTTNYSLWPNTPRIVLEDCRIMGTMVAVYGSSTDPRLATQFKRCHFLWNPSMSPTGALFNSGGVAKFHDPGSSGSNIRLDECTLEWNTATDGVGSQTTFGLWNNCTIKASAAGYVQAFGTFSGTDTVFTNCASIPRQDQATLLAKNYAGASYDSFTSDGTRYESDTDRATGKKLYYGSATYDPPSLAAAAKTTIQTMTVTGVALGDKLEDVSFSNNLAGARIAAWVSAANTVSFYVINENGANPLDLASGTIRVKVRQA